MAEGIAYNLFSDMLSSDNLEMITVYDYDSKDQSAQARCMRDFISRVETFTAAHWSHRSCQQPLLSPLECARFGWRCSATDTLRCDACGEMLVPQMSGDGHSGCDSLGHDSDVTSPVAAGSCVRRRRQRSSTSDYLLQGHREHCSWRFSALPKSVYDPDFNNSRRAFSRFIADVGLLVRINTDLPHLEPPDIKDVDRLVDWWLRHKSDDISVPRVDIGLATTAVLLALCGWYAYDSHRPIIWCKLCRRRIGLWNFRRHIVGDESAAAAIAAEIKSATPPPTINGGSGEQHSASRRAAIRLAARRESIFGPAATKSINGGGGGDVPDGGDQVGECSPAKRRIESQLSSPTSVFASPSPVPRVLAAAASPPVNGGSDDHSCAMNGGGGNCVTSPSPSCAKSTPQATPPSSISPRANRPIGAFDPVTAHWRWCPWWHEEPQPRHHSLATTAAESIRQPVMMTIATTITAAAADPADAAGDHSSGKSVDETGVVARQRKRGLSESSRRIHDKFVTALLEAMEASSSAVSILDVIGDTAAGGGEGGQLNNSATAPPVEKSWVDSVYMVRRVLKEAVSGDCEMDDDGDGDGDNIAATASSLRHQPP